MCLDHPWLTVIFLAGRIALMRSLPSRRVRVRKLFLNFPVCAYGHLWVTLIQNIYGSGVSAISFGRQLCPFLTHGVYLILCLIYMFCVVFSLFLFYCALACASIRSATFFHHFWLSVRPSVRLSVCLSVRHIVVLYLNECCRIHISSNFFNRLVEAPSPLQMGPPTYFTRYSKRQPNFVWISN